MGSDLLRSICQAGIFVICAQVIVHFRPAKSYEKYLKMLVSAMILVQLLRPLGGIFDKKDAESLESRIRWLDEQLRENRERVENDSARGEELREQMTLEEVRRRLEEERNGGEIPEKYGMAENNNIHIEEINPVEIIHINHGKEGETDAGSGESAGDHKDSVEKMVPPG